MRNREVKQAGDSIKSWEIGQVFDEMSDQYTDIMDHMVPSYRKLIASMLKYLPESFKPCRILDLGCGNGNVAGVSMALFPDAHHHLVDASDEMIRMCKVRFAGSFNTYEHNVFQRLKFTPDTYDLVLAGFSLHHLDAVEKAQFFANLCPAMTEKGIFACADLFVNKDSQEHAQVLSEWKKFIFRSGKSAEDWNWLMDHYNAYDRPSKYTDQQRWLSKAGFARVELSWNDRQWGCYHAHKR
jgi:tRNA (cmo5U34)-methyltransferase